METSPGWKFSLKVGGKLLGWVFLKEKGESGSREMNQMRKERGMGLVYGGFVLELELMTQLWEITNSSLLQSIPASLFHSLPYRPPYIFYILPTATHPRLRSFHPFYKTLAFNYSSYSARTKIHRRRRMVEIHDEPSFSVRFVPLPYQFTSEKDKFLSKKKVAREENAKKKKIISISPLHVSSPLSRSTSVVPLFCFILLNKLYLYFIYFWPPPHPLTTPTFSIRFFSVTLCWQSFIVFYFECKKW